MKITTVFVSDRRNLYLPQCMTAFAEYVIGADIAEAFVVNDADHMLGLAGAVRESWRMALDQDSDYLLHWEEDMVVTDPLDVGELAAILDGNRHLAQVVLKRQPWSPEECRAGGIMEMNPELYTEHTDGHRHWVEHDRIFSLNPCLIPRRVLAMGWPDGNEAQFTKRCHAEGLSFAFYGTIHALPRIEHIGVQRGQGWRL